MLATLTIARYPLTYSWAGFLSMASFRLPLMLNKALTFYKLLGSGKNGTFDKTPDLQQWGLFSVLTPVASAKLQQVLNTGIDDPAIVHALVYGKMISKWWKLCGCECWTIVLQPLEGHGKWDGKHIFGQLSKSSGHNGPVAVLTRATIRLNKLNRFWQHVDEAAKDMATIPGFVLSLGVGEVPWVKQATFSIWQSKDAMKQYAYKMKNHAEVVRKTRAENWYKEEMFVRFAIVSSLGTLNRKLPLHDIL